MVDLTAILPAPHREDYRDNKMWVDEQIWGHRLWDSESPWMLFLEFLTVAEACHRSEHLFDENTPQLFFRPHKRIHLRNILFNNETLFQIDERYPESGTAWTKWLEWIGDHAKGVVPRDFSYLKARFQSFRQFVSLVGMLRRSAVESETNKRWSSRFVFPFGPNALYEDLNINAAGNVSREYINFGRTGELLYLMLCRSSLAAQLKDEFNRLLEGNNPWNKLLALFQPAGHEDQETRKNSFLPYSKHLVFDRLGEDWLHVLTLRLPGFDAFPHMVTLGAMHVLLYQLTVAAEWTDTRLHFICEVLAPKKTLVRELSALNYQANTPEQARIILIDPKQGVDYFPFEDLPHLAGPMIVDPLDASARLDQLVAEMDSRYGRFRAARSQNLNQFNEKVPPSERLPVIWVIHDEFAEWMMVDTYKEAVTNTVARLGVKARAAGIHLVFAAQRPDANVMPMQLRANLGNRLILKVDSVGTSEIALGESGAEWLLGHGHLLAKLEGSPGLLYAQVPLADPPFIEHVVDLVSVS